MWPLIPKTQPRLVPPTETCFIWEAKKGGKSQVKPANGQERACCQALSSELANIHRVQPLQRQTGPGHWLCVALKLMHVGLSRDGEGHRTTGPKAPPDSSQRSLNTGPASLQRSGVSIQHLKSTYHPACAFKTDSSPDDEPSSFPRTVLVLVLKSPGNPSVSGKLGWLVIL